MSNFKADMCDFTQGYMKYMQKDATENIENCGWRRDFFKSKNLKIVYCAQKAESCTFLIQGGHTTFHHPAKYTSSFAS